MNNFNLTFYLRRAHSLCGLVCLGLFLMEHIFTNSQILLSTEMFNNSVAMLASIPAYIMIPLEIVLVCTPFLFHGIYGIYICLQAKNNPCHYNYIQNWQFALQRWTAWYLVPFLIWHVAYLRLVVKGGGTPITFEFLAQYLGNPLYWLLYLLGMWAAVFHFCNGITTFCMTWGIAKGPRIQMIINVCCMGLCGFLCLFTLGFMILYLFPVSLLNLG